MDKQKATISIWRDAIGYAYRDNNEYKSQLTMQDVFGRLIARLTATIQYSEDFGEIAEYEIEITKRVYND